MTQSQTLRVKKNRQKLARAAARYFRELGENAVKRRKPVSGKPSLNEVDHPGH
jgi:hypothetical protein